MVLGNTLQVHMPQLSVSAFVTSLWNRIVLAITESRPFASLARNISHTCIEYNSTNTRIVPFYPYGSNKSFFHRSTNSFSLSCVFKQLGHFTTTSLQNIHIT